MRRGRRLNRRRPPAHVEALEGPPEVQQAWLELVEAYRSRQAGQYAFALVILRAWERERREAGR